MIHITFENLYLFVCWLAVTSLRASVLIGLVILFQWIFRRWVSPRWRYALWLIVVVSLFTPSLLQSKFSIFNFAKLNSSNKAKTEMTKAPIVPKITYGDVVPTKVSTLQVKSVPVPSSTEVTATPITVTSIQKNAPAPITKEPKRSWREMLSVFWTENFTQIVVFSWLAGVLFLVFRFILPVYRLASQISKLRPLTDSSALNMLEECKTKMGIKTPLWVVEAPHIHSPVLMGFIRPKLLLPVGIQQTFTLGELRFIFLHELSHLKQKDIILNWLTTILQIFYWFNPIIWFAFSRMRADREAACDALALSCSSEGENQKYGATILKLLENFTKERSPLPVLAGILETKQQLKKRMTMIMQFKKNKSIQAILPVSLLVILVITGLTAAQKEQEPSSVKFKQIAPLQKAVKGVKTADSNEIEIAKQESAVPAHEVSENSIGEEGGGGGGGGGLPREISKDTISVEIRYLVMTRDIADEILALDQKNKTSICLKEETLERIRELEQKKQITVASNPKLTTRNGQAGQVSLTKEFIYSDSWDAPQIAISTNTNVPPQIAMPSPSGFKPIDLGTILSVVPKLSKDQNTITFSGISPQLIDLVGKTKNKITFSTREPFYIEPPIFSKRELKTSFTMRNGGSVLLGKMSAPEKLQSKESIDPQIMLIVLTAFSEGEESPNTKAATSDSLKISDRLIFTDTKLIAMSRETAREILNQEIGAQKSIEVSPKLFEKIHTAIKAKKIQVIDDLGLVAAVSPITEEGLAGQDLSVSSLYGSTYALGGLGGLGGGISESLPNYYLSSLREFLYADAWDPPQIGEGVEVGPAPSSFKARELGTLFTITANLQNNSTISASLTLGYEEEVSHADYFAVDRMPQFSTRSLKTNITLKSDQMVILSGGEAPESIRNAHPEEDWQMFTLIKATVYTP